ncbi:Lipase 5, variant 2 [Balamuthia mandrillaris]
MTSSNISNSVVPATSGGGGRTRRWRKGEPGGVICFFYRYLLFPVYFVVSSVLCCFGKGATSLCDVFLFFLLLPFVLMDKLVESIKSLSWRGFVLSLPVVGNIMEQKWKQEQAMELLQLANTYEEWKAAAKELDRITGKEAWKADKRSPYYDHELIEHRLKLLRGLSEKKDWPPLLLALRAGLMRDMGGIGNPRLHNYCHIGTKHLIEEYIIEIVKQLEFISDSDILTEYGFDDRKKLEFFLETRQAFGRTALMLSGGATLGMYHFGVIKSLFEEKLLPRVISGSSVGSLVSALICTRTDDELPELFTKTGLEADVFENSQRGSLKRKVHRFITKGVLMDIRKLEAFMRTNLGDVTFKEAFDRTGRILNITIASTTTFEVPRLLNYLTAPNVLIWSAACASCALAGLYEPVALMAKDSEGTIRLYQHSSVKWSDGSVETDLPMARLAELFNINHSIVSQVNPHVVPFLRYHFFLSPRHVLASASYTCELSPFVC